MTPDELIARYPQLHHMAERDGWPRIQTIGLRTTKQLVDACDPDPTTRAAILRERRPHSVRLQHPDVGTITIRDQKPLGLHNLKLLDGSVEDFLELLNTRVFMWTSADRLKTLLGAELYRTRWHDVLVLDTRSIVERYADRIRLTGMNTGASIFPSSPSRGSASFMRIEDFPLTVGPRGGVRNPVVELCVIDGIDDIERHVIRVDRRQGDRSVETLYERWADSAYSGRGTTIG